MRLQIVLWRASAESEIDEGGGLFIVIFPGNLVMDFIKDTVKIELCSSVAIGGFVCSKARAGAFTACWLRI